MTKYNDLIPAESSSLTEKPSEVSDSQVSPGAAHGDRDPGWGGGCWEPPPRPSARSFARHEASLGAFLGAALLLLPHPALEAAASLWLRGTE